MFLLGAARDGMHGAGPLAGAASDTGVCDLVGHQGGAHLGTTDLVLDVLFVLFTKVPNRAEHGVGGGLSQPAQRRRFEHSAQLLQSSQVFWDPLPPCDSFEDPEQLLGPLTTRCTLSTRLKSIKLRNR